MRLPLVILGVVAALATLAVQLVADGLYGALAVPGSLPRALAGDWPFALAARSGLDGWPPVRMALARGALVRGEPARAAVLLAGLPPSSSVDDLRGRAALAAGDTASALHDFVLAGDFIAAQPALDALGARDPVAALAIVRDFERRLTADTFDPEITAEVAWRAGGFASRAAQREPARAPAYEREARAAYGRALARAPDDEKYLLSVAFAALAFGDAPAARAAYARAARVVPDGVDAYAGLALAAAAQGDCPAARAAHDRARDLAAAQGRSIDPGAAGYAPAVRVALARCLR